MAKSLMICPFCDDGRAFTWQGVVAHVRSKHPDKLSEMKDNKAMYLEKFACDEVGNPIAAPEPTPADPPTPEPEPKTPAPEVTPLPVKEKPAEGGLFHRIGTGFTEFIS
jgi:hypothetical protein